MQVNDNVFARAITAMRRERVARWPCPYDNPSIYAGLKHFLNCELHENTKAFVDAVCNAQRANPWLMIVGGVGRGKTAVIRCILAGIAAANVRPTQMVASARDLAANDTFQQRARKVELLYIDDLGTEPTEVKSYGTSTQPLAGLIEHRYDANLCTFLTSNLRGEKMNEMYGARVVSRLVEMCGIVDADKYFAKSLRTKK